MRTTLDIDSDVLSAAKELAKRSNTTAGHVISELARTALTTPARPQTASEPESICGFRPFPKTGRLVTNELIDKLRDEDAY